MTEDFKRKLTAILSADVVGYSRLMGDDEAATVKTLETYKGVMSSLIKQHRGRVVDSPGDNLLAEFGSVVDAVQCAVSIQKELQTRNADLPEKRRMEFRIGINLGDVIEEEDRIYGDGVNIAARLEALADPGGICVSKTAFDQIESKLPFGYRFIGEQTVKNIAKPVGAYKVLMETRLIDEEEQKTKTPFWRKKAALSIGIIMILAIAVVLYWKFYHLGPSIEPASVERMAYSLPDKPSIAVLPFTNRSGDPEQDYIGDGLSENIINALSVSSQIFVIASNSTFTYKGKAVDIKQVAEDLGVQYVLEGSIQKSDNQLRVTAQLIDALSGHQLWSEKYDREMKNLFDLQDEITKKIMVSMQVVLSGSEEVRVYAKSTDNLEAWKHYIKGLELWENIISSMDNLKAREYFELALELDPEFVAALSMLAETHSNDFIYEWSDSPVTSMNRAIKLAQKAVELDEQDPYAHAALGWILLFQRQHEKAITEGKRAITLNPNYSEGYILLASVMNYSGQFDEAITQCKKASRLDPNPPLWYFMTLATSYIFLERYEEALEIVRELEKKALPGSRPEAMTKTYFSWIYQELGKKEEARAYMAEALKIKPDYSLENWANEPYKDPDRLQRQLDAFRKAGMPEHPPGVVKEKPSIAVLPFDNLSSDPEQEYFVLGLSEEILNSLAQISDLTVIAKTSSFSYKDTKKKIQEIASELGIDHVLEGSVRKAGNSIRITAQLIKAYDESHLWSETYDKDLDVKNIFAVQEDIAKSVADKLKLTFGIGKSHEKLGGTDNLEAYELYLAALGNWHGSSRRYSQALALIDKAISLDPEFATAWALKSIMHLMVSVSISADQIPLELDKGLNAAMRAVELEPSLGKAYLSLGSIHTAKAEYIEAELAYREGMKLTTESMDYFDYGLTYHYSMVGYLRKCHKLLEEIRQKDPLRYFLRLLHMIHLGLIGDIEGAEEEYERSKAIFGDQWNNSSVVSWISVLRLGAKDVLSINEIPESPIADPLWSTARDHIESPEKGLEELHRLYRTKDNLSTDDFYSIAIWAAYYGDPEFALKAMEKSVSLRPGTSYIYWAPLFHEVRQLPRYKKFVRELGLVNYWKKFGWPDLCRPLGDDDFECD